MSITVSSLGRGLARARGAQRARVGAAAPGAASAPAGCARTAPYRAAPALAALARRVAAATLASIAPLAANAGVATVAVTRAASSQPVDDAQLQAVARAELSSWLGAQHLRFEIEPAADNPPLGVPGGRVGLKARPVAPRQALAARLLVWVDVSVDGRFVRSQPVALQVHAYRRAWVATEDVAVGRDLPTAPFESREIDVAAARGLPLEGALPAARLRRRLLAGAPLTAADIERTPAVQRGAAVTLRARLGEIGIESRGEALQDGEPGQRIWVKVATSTGPVLAQVVGAGLVEMQP